MIVKSDNGIEQKTRSERQTKGQMNGDLKV